MSVTAPRRSFRLTGPSLVAALNDIAAAPVAPRPDAENAESEASDD